MVNQLPETVFDWMIVGGVPEPGAWTLMIAGLGLAGAALRRRRALAAAWRRNRPQIPSWPGVSPADDG